MAATATVCVSDSVLVDVAPLHVMLSLQHGNTVCVIIIIINPCKPYHFGIGTAPHPLGRWRVD
jgi:hypothetical protein